MRCKLSMRCFAGHNTRADAQLCCCSLWQVGTRSDEPVLSICLTGDAQELLTSVQIWLSICLMAA